MKRIIILLSISMLFGVLNVGCNREEVLYDGAEYVMFADTMDMFAVSPDAEHEIVVASTVSCDYDRTFAIEVVDQGSTAIEGIHYELKSNNVVIKAGERSGKITMVGKYNNIETTDSIGVVLRLVSPDAVKWNMYGDQTKVVFMKSCPFSTETFVEDGGYYIFYAAFPFSESTVKRLIRAERLDNDRLVFKKLFDKDHDIQMRFNAEDPFNPTVDVLPQEAIFVSNYGLVIFETTTMAPSYFYSCQKLIDFYMTASVEKVGYFGTFRYILEWIDSATAKEIENNGFPGQAGGI